MLKKNKKNLIEAKGVITKEHGRCKMTVELEDPVGHTCLCTISGRLQKYKIQLLVGDKVAIELSPYDLTKGRIVLREK